MEIYVCQCCVYVVPVYLTLLCCSDSTIFPAKKVLRKFQYWTKKILSYKIKNVYMPLGCEGGGQFVVTID